MARAVKKKKTPGRAVKRKNGLLSWLNLKSILYTLFLLTLLIVSVGMLTYVIFFRVVVAAEIHSVSDTTIIFEEPTEPDVLPMGEAYSVETENKPKIAIIIDDMGYHQHVGESLINLPYALSFSFLPHAPFTLKLEDMAFKRGKTVLLHLPLEPKDRKWDPGPGALYLEELDLQSDIFQQNLSMVPHATGVNNHMGSRYTEDIDGMQALLELVAEKKLFFIDSYTSSDSLGYTLAKSKGLKSARRTLFLDNILDSGEICSQLKKLAAAAQERGEAIGIAHPHKETLEAIQTCIGIIQNSAELVGVESLVD